MPQPFDAQAGWDVHPQVSVRPEPFGALLYHYGTRRLSFLKDPRLAQVVRGLADHPSPVAAYRAVGVTEADHDRFTASLARLAGTDMLVRREAP